ncbi:hypothetical protein [Terriglobus saanensis]|nr:hypothetical protein [Terriglobus saanensis]
MKKLAHIVIALIALVIVSGEFSPLAAQPYHRRHHRHHHHPRR